MDYIKRAFSIRSIRERGAASKNPEVFRFDSPRIYATLRPPDAMLSEEPVYKAQFEIQVRTAYEHAWIVATHPLVYKGDEADWKRLRVAAQMKAMVEQLDLLNVAFTDVSSKVAESTWPDVSMRIAVIEQFSRAVDEGVIPREVAPDSWRRFADNFVSLIQATCARQDVYRRGNDALTLVMNELAANYSGERFLRSVSLMQFVLGVLCDKRFLDSTPEQYTPVVTPELLAFFPATEVLRTSFSF